MYEIYTIQNGDTIEIIAQKLGIDLNWTPKVGQFINSF